MKKTYLKLIICILIVVAFGCMAVACNVGMKPDHFDHLVTFDYNYGNLEANCPTQYLGVMDGKTVALRPNAENDAFREGTISGYYLEGWYTAKVDEEGKPIKDANGFVALDKKWDFDNNVVTKDITLYANFLKRATLSIIDRATDEVLDTIVATPGAVRKQPSKAPVKDGYTCTGIYYTEKTGDEVFEWPYTFGTEDVQVYVEFVEGNWAIVRNATELNNAIINNLNIYLLNDIDYSESVWMVRDFHGVINGNGYKVKNIHTNITYSRTGGNNYSGLFGTLKANIYNVSFEDVSITFNSPDNVVGLNIALFARQIGTEATLNNVALSGTLTYASHGGAVTAHQFAITNECENINDCDFSLVNIVES